MSRREVHKCCCLQRCMCKLQRCMCKSSKSKVDVFPGCLDSTLTFCILADTLSTAYFPCTGLAITASTNWWVRRPRKETARRLNVKTVRCPLGVLVPRRRASMMTTPSDHARRVIPETLVIRMLPSTCRGALFSSLPRGSPEAFRPWRCAEGSFPSR